MSLPGRLFEKIPVQKCHSRRQYRPGWRNCPGLGVSGRYCGHQLGEPDNIEDAPEIIGKRGQAESGTDLLQAAH
jgi:hypothetical protein